MQKNCEICHKSYRTKDSRQKTCSYECSRKLKRFKSLLPNPPIPLSEKEIAYGKVVAHRLDDRINHKLPPPEELPAPYAKRVHDMWAALTGEGDTPTRIA